MSRLCWLLSIAFVAAVSAQPLGIALDSYTYPHPVKFLPMQIEGQDLRMAYMDVPSSGAPNGRTVVLMHGKNFGGYYWANVIAFLASNGYRVVVPDQIGWGKSSKPDIRYSFHLLAANTAQLLDKLNVGRAVVIGHSTGGMLAVRFALSYPDRVSQLVLEGPLGMEDYRAIPRSTDDELYQQELNNTDPDKIRAVFRRYFASPKEDIYGPLAEVPVRVTASGEYARWAKASALAYQMIYEQPVRYEYRLLKPPTLLMVGEKDHTVPLSAKAPQQLRERMGHFPELAQQAAKEIPNASAVVVPDCGHIPHIEKPEIFQRELLEFLRKGTD
jgi:pimeloyl-ACP methyl ester carboxylesterase